MFARLTALLTLVAGASAWVGGPQVKLNHGTISGGTCNTTGSDASYFLGIPYAKPPTGALRFQPPVAFNQNYGNGSGRLDATSKAPACIQFGGGAFAEAGPQSEDCLFVDVYKPRNAAAHASLPVKVFIYGGSDVTGGISNLLYDGCNLAASDAVFVSINYRLGPLGWLAINSTQIKGNMALQDILLGLQWVQDNIKAFGGDPREVLLFGQSAGAYNSFTVSALPQAPKLMNAVVLESGGGRDLPTPASAHKLGDTFATALNCSTSELACFQNSSMANIQGAFNASTLVLSTGTAFGVDSVNTTSFAPYFDGVVVPAQPSEAGVQIPAIFGYNSRDASLFTVEAFNGDPTSATADNYSDFLLANFGPTGAALVNKTFPLTFPAFVATGFAPYAAIEYVYTYAQYGCPARRGLLGAAARGISAYAYEFAHTPSCSWFPGQDLSAEDLAGLGPAHTAELPFVFGHTSGLPAPNGNCSFTPAEKAISSSMVAAWTAMAATGSPSRHNAAWPAWNASAGLGWLVNTTATPGVVDFAPCALFDAVIALNGGVSDAKLGSL